MRRRFESSLSRGELERLKAFRLPGHAASREVAGEFILVGVQRGTTPGPLALLAKEGDWGLEFAGSAVLDLPREDVDRFWRAVEPLRCDYPHVKIDRRAAEWLRPELRIRVGKVRD